MTALAEISEIATRAISAMAHPVLICDEDNRVLMANFAAQDFFQTSENLLRRQRINDYVAPTSPLLALLARAHVRQAASSERKIAIGNVNLPGERLVDVHVSPMGDDMPLVVVTLFPQTMADKIERQLSSRGGARQVAGLAAMLAHEVKNPLSGIKGAAQLLEQNADTEDQPLARLVQSEVERIVKLVDRMEVFGDECLPEMTPVNIHATLDHVLMLAAQGFAKGIEIDRQFDPSLPEIPGNRDQLVQAFLNLVKNAAEAARGEPNALIRVSTAYRPGLHVGVPGTHKRLSLPLEVSVEDNGSGIAEDLLPCIFEPFVSSRQNGSGLGLAMVAKIIRAHGGIVDAESARGKTIFKTLLPMVRPKRRQMELSDG